MQMFETHVIRRRSAFDFMARLNRLSAFNFVTAGSRFVTRCKSLIASACNKTYFTLFRIGRLSSFCLDRADVCARFE